MCSHEQCGNIFHLQNSSTVEHDFNGHEVNGIHEVNGKKCHNRAVHFVNKLHDFKGIHDLSGNFCYDDFFRKSHARLYWIFKVISLRHVIIAGSGRQCEGQGCEK